MKTKSDVKLERLENLQGNLSVIPVILIILAIKGYPIIVALIKSFTNWDGLTKNSFIGLQNYIFLITNGELWLLMRNTSLLLLYVPLQVLFGLIVALLLYEQVPGWKAFRSIFYLPQVLSLVIIGSLFRIIFSYDGPINYLLRAIGLESLAIEWLGNTATSLPIIVLCLVWMNIGWQALIFTGGMAGINPSVFDAAKIDGAAYWQRFFKIIIPMLVRTIEYSFIISVIWVFTSIFPIIYTLTYGGPGYETTTIDYMIYVKAFLTSSQLGMACALAIILTVIVLIITRIQMVISDKSDKVGE